MQPLPTPPTSLPLPGQRVAVKCVDCRRFRSIAELEAVQEEAALLSSLRHRYIVRLLAVRRGWGVGVEHGLHTQRARARNTRLFAGQACSTQQAPAPAPTCTLP